jgi:signal transduction histidine kinase
MVGAMSPETRASLRGRRRGISLSRRLALQLFALVVLLGAACAWVSLALVERAFERQLSAELTRCAQRVEASLDAERRALADSLERLEAHLAVRERSLLERLLAGGPGAGDIAGRLLLPAGLDSLEVLDSAGVVISSAPRQERVGLPLGTVQGPEAAAGPARPVRLEEFGGGPWGLRLGRRLSVGTRELWLVGANVLDESFLESVAGSGAALLLDGDGGAPVTSPAGRSLDPQQVVDALAVAGGSGSDVIAAGRDASRWLVRPVALPRGDDGRPLTIAVAVELSRLDPVLARMRRAFLVVGSLGGLIAALAGVWIARRITRPVRELVHAFDAVSSGEADYTFPAPRQDELQELIASVSRLQRALEMQQRRSIAAERVATWRDVARHVAHEVKNPLAPIRLTVQNLIRARGQAPERFDPMFREGMRTILDEVEQLSRMVGEFSEFARLPLPTPRPQDLEQLVESVLELFASDPGITVERRYAAGLPLVPVDADQISRALKNIVGNAVEARAGSALRLEVTTFLEDDMVGVEVADDGPGFSEESARRVFEPYFTTRSGGTGLGMALTYRIIVEHGGVITAGNRPQGGATVSIRLPLRAHARDGAEKPVGR